VSKGRNYTQTYICLKEVFSSVFFEVVVQPEAAHFAGIGLKARVGKRP
jgi:hypothetical protein